MEIDPYNWQLPSNPMLGHSMLGALPPPLVTTSIETGPVTLVGPSASMTMDSTRRRIPERPHPHSDFTVSHFGGADSNLQREGVQPKQLTYEEAAGLTTGTTTLTLNDTGRLPITLTTHEGHLMELTGSSRVYPDLMLPVPGNPHISQVFFANTQLQSMEGNSLTIVKVTRMGRMYGITIFAVDHLSWQFNVILRDGVIPIDLYGLEDVPATSALQATTIAQFTQTPTPLAALTPIVSEAVVDPTRNTLKPVPEQISSTEEEGSTEGTIHSFPQ